jgi:hypothetical protein
MASGSSGSGSNGGNPQQPAYAARVVIAGLVAIVIVFGVATARFHKAADIATAVGAVSGVIAALVGAYFGIRGATLAQSQSTPATGGDGVDASGGGGAGLPPAQPSPAQPA